MEIMADKSIRAEYGVILAVELAKQWKNFLKLFEVRMRSMRVEFLQDKKVESKNCPAKC